MTISIRLSGARHQDNNRVTAYAAAVVQQFSGFDHLNGKPVRVEITTERNAGVKRANGLGQAAILHANFTVVGPNSPAQYGETVQVFLTGLGAVTPTIADGSAAPTSPLRVTKAPPAVFSGEAQGAIAFPGLAPGLAALYQINVTLPASGPGGTLALAFSTASSLASTVPRSVRTRSNDRSCS